MMKPTTATFAFDVSSPYQIRLFSAALSILKGPLSFIMVSQVRVMHRHLCPV